jgi:hypothetical protein
LLAVAVPVTITRREYQNDTPVCRHVALHQQTSEMILFAPAAIDKEPALLKAMNAQTRTPSSRCQ